MIAEIAQTPRKVHETNWKEHSHIVNQEQFVRTLLSGRPLVLISGHFGNFELGGYLMGLFGFPTYTVARELDNPYLDRFINDFRGRTGQYMLPKKGSGADIQKVLERGGILTLLGRSARRPTTVLGQLLRQARVDAQSGLRVLARQPGADDGQLRPPARSSRCTTKSAPKRSAIRATRTSNSAPFRSWPSGTPTIWKISSAARPANTGGSTAAGRASPACARKRDVAKRPRSGVSEEDRDNARLGDKRDSLSTRTSPCLPVSLSPRLAAATIAVCRLSGLTTPARASVYTLPAVSQFRSAAPGRHLARPAAAAGPDAAGHARPSRAARFLEAVFRSGGPDRRLTTKIPSASSTPALARTTNRLRSRPTSARPTS